MFFPASGALRWIMYGWIMVFVGWFALSLAIQSKNDPFSQYSGNDYASVIFNLQVLSLQIIMAAISVSVAIYADWRRDRASRQASIFTQFATFMCWFLVLMASVESAFESDDGNINHFLCGGGYYDNHFFCDTMYATAVMACVAVVLHALLVAWSLYFDSQMKAYHDHAMAHLAQPDPNPQIKYMLILAEVGCAIWMGSVFALVAEDYSSQMVLGPSPYMPVFFIVCCALVPLVHTNRVIAVVTFWMTCLASIYGWAFIVYYIRGTMSSTLVTYCSTSGQWWCQAQVSSVAGAAVLTFALTVLAFMIAYFHIHTPDNAPLFAHQQPVGAFVAGGGADPIFGVPEGQGQYHPSHPIVPHGQGHAGYGYGYGSYEPVQEEGGGTG